MTAAIDDPCSEDEATEGGAALAALHAAYLASLRQHRTLVADLCKTIRRIESALAGGDAVPADLRCLTAGIREHIETADRIVSRMDGAMRLDAPKDGRSLH